MGPYGTPLATGEGFLSIKFFKKGPLRENLGTNLMEVGAFQTEVNTNLGGNSEHIFSVWKARGAWDLQRIGEQVPNRDFNP